MNKNNGYLFLIVTFGAGIIIGNLFSRFAGEDEAVPRITQDHSHTIRILETQLSDANKTIAALRQAELIRPSFATSSTPPDSKAEAAAPTMKSDIERIKNLEAQLMAQKAKEMNQWLLDGYAKSRNFDPGEVMQQRFDAEPADPVWAKEQENKLMATFSSQPELAEFALLDTQCKASLCQVSISFTDMEQANHIAAQVSKNVSVMNKLTSVIASPNNGKKVTTLYISHADEITH